MPDLDLHRSRFRVSESVVFRELDGEAVILNVDSGVYFGLDRVGTRVWQLVGENGDLPSMAARLEQEYEVTRDVLERDLESFITTLVEKGLIVRVDDR
jgi:hypothetical protein